MVFGKHRIQLHCIYQKINATTGRKKKSSLRVQLYNQKLKLSTSKPQETLFLLKFKLKFIVKKMPKKVITIIKVTYTTEQGMQHRHKQGHTWI